MDLDTNHDNSMEFKKNSTLNTLKFHRYNKASKGLLL